MLQQYITITLYQQQAITQGVEDATKVGGLGAGAVDFDGMLAHRQAAGHHTGQGGAWITQHGL